MAIRVYKRETVVIRPQSPPSVDPPIDYLTGLLNRVAPQQAPPSRTSSPKDQYAQYLEESVSQVLIMQYWRAKELEWPQLASMAFDLLAVPAMSSECERVFSSCAKQSTPENSRLTGRMLWHQECLNNWQRRGAIQISRAFNGAVIDWGSDNSD
jgi:hypothetical protein